MSVRIEDFPKVIEAIVFVAENPVTVDDMLHALSRSTEFTNVDVDQLRDKIITAIDVIINRYSSNNSALEFRSVAGGYQFYSRPAYASFVREAIVSREARKLSKTVLETLSIIAYRQPVSKSELDFIRGVDCGYAITKLLEKQLIEPAGRADTPGRPLLYRSSNYFMEYFGIKSLEDMPKLKEIVQEEDFYEETYKIGYLFKDEYIKD